MESNLYWNTYVQYYEDLVNVFYVKFNVYLDGGGGGMYWGGSRQLIWNRVSSHLLNIHSVYTYILSVELAFENIVYNI